MKSPWTGLGDSLTSGEGLGEALNKALQDALEEVLKEVLKEALENALWLVLETLWAPLARRPERPWGTTASRGVAHMSGNAPGRRFNERGGLAP